MTMILSPDKKAIENIRKQKHLSKIANLRNQNQGVYMPKMKTHKVQQSGLKNLKWKAEASEETSKSLSRSEVSKT